MTAKQAKILDREYRDINTLEDSYEAISARDTLAKLEAEMKKDLNYQKRLDRIQLSTDSLEDKLEKLLNL